MISTGLDFDKIQRSAHRWLMRWSKLTKVISLLGLLMINGGCAAKEISVSLSVEESSLEHGRVILVAQLSNNTDQPITFLPWNTPFEGEMLGNNVRVFNQADNAELRYQGPMVKRRAPIDSDYVTLAPGDSLSVKTDLSQAYDFCNNTKYRVEPNTNLFDSNYASIPFKATPATFETQDGFIAC